MNRNRFGYRLAAGMRDGATDLRIAGLLRRHKCDLVITAFDATIIAAPLKTNEVAFVFHYSRYPGGTVGREGVLTRFKFCKLHLRHVGRRKIIAGAG